MNLITDPWIPVKCKEGRRVIAPWQIAESDVLFPDWPRPDFNVACLELLIGLVYMATPPSDKKDWKARTKPDPEGLRTALEAYAPAFFLMGDGPRFLQDYDKLDGAPKPVDTLFIDSASDQAKKENRDLMVHRQRYKCLTLPEAAMALYTLQDFAPAGGSGYLTSMRGGGPLVTILDPGKTLWDLVWLNVPFGQPSMMKDLPWMRPTRTSEKGKGPVRPNDGKDENAPPFTAEAFFGMPRRLRLVGDEQGITGVIQKRHGTNYEGWQHPLSPYYRMKSGEMPLPRHPRAGRFGYRNWLGVLIVGKPSREDEEGLEHRALILQEWDGMDRPTGKQVSVIVAGWAMSKGSPLDFVFSRQPMQICSAEAVRRVKCFIEAAEMVASMLHQALASLLDKGEARDAQREEFYLKTEPAFYEHFRDIAEGGNPAEAWLGEMRDQALSQFDVLAKPGLSERGMKEMKAIAEARKFLSIALHGHGKKTGASLFQKLGLPVPTTKAQKKGQAA
ncbi:type I-E CRISPR-associated protein Cse1/CasA [Bombella pollinis]|uniref:Type I-E CRISPR-associated protein Cse1/CasA n=1 Tax=Bombella pollinis TaxID=2967337 RepID=A0ABT3WN13_9PROT|nr:type I-E CRISPR-associated protein Cse1/CasA [Bombella pollinis]MCX5620303.1 type I-E CRISPR-associated protein Cse1/CasA [Bombella pollinis]